MNLAKTILIAGFAAVSSLLLPGCGTTLSGPEFAEASPLVSSPVPLSSISYLADYTQDGALPFTCEVLMRSDDMIRRNYVWKDETGTEKKVSVVINGPGAIRIEDGKSSRVDDSATVMARFFARLVFSPDTAVSSVDENVRTAANGASMYVYWVRLDGAPGVESCVVDVDPKSRLWTGLQVRMKDGSGDVSTVFPEYRSESGTTFPSQIVSSTGDGAPVRCLIRDVKINPELPDELFRIPDNNG